MRTVSMRTVGNAARPWAMVTALLLVLGLVVGVVTPAGFTPLDVAGGVNGSTDDASADPSVQATPGGDTTGVVASADGSGYWVQFAGGGT